MNLKLKSINQSHVSLKDNIQKLTTKPGSYFKKIKSPQFTESLQFSDKYVDNQSIGNSATNSVLKAKAKNLSTRVLNKNYYQHNDLEYIEHDTKSNRINNSNTHLGV